MTRDADIALLRVALESVISGNDGAFVISRPAWSETVTFADLAAALYDAGLRPSVEPAGLRDVERLTSFGMLVAEDVSAVWSQGDPRRVVREWAEDFALLPTQASDSPEPCPVDCGLIACDHAQMLASDSPEKP